jgi:dipeptidyl aminopeptidase/acylaminoacyl peptidase
MARLLTSRDLLRFSFTDDPQLSPDGKQVAWVKTWIVPEENRYQSAIFVTSVQSGKMKRLTLGKARATHPCWSPDGRHIAFLSSPANKKAQLYVISSQGGNPRVITDVKNGVQEPVWSPDGRLLAFTTPVDIEKGLEPSVHETRADLYTRFNQDVAVIKRHKWKADGVGIFGDERKHIAVVSFNKREHHLPTPQLLTKGDFDLSNPVWSPDSRNIAAISNLHSNADRVRKQYIYLVNPQKPLARPRELFGLEDIRDTGLSWSPDGKTLAVAGHDNPSIGHYGNQQLWLVSVKTGEATCVTKTFDRTLGHAAYTDVGGYGGESGVRWLPDGSAVLALVSDKATVRLCRIDVSGKVSPLTPPEQFISAFTLDATGKYAALLASEPLHPGDIYFLKLATGSNKRISSVNKEVLKNLELSKPIAFKFQSDDLTVDAWLIPPPKRKKGKRYPAILYTGGGPGGMRCDNFMLEYQLLAAQGYSVIFCNARGCQGYGEKFCTAILGSWGEADHADNMRCLEVALKRFDFIDAKRLGIAGGSYGGYLVNWAIGHTQKFRVAVSDRSVVNRYSSFGTSDIGYLREFEFGGGPPWETTSYYLKQSPLQNFANATTPTLVIHSAFDYRCAVEQGEQVYLALKQLGVPTEFVRFPNESHGLSRGGRPWHRVYRLDKYLEWFRRWL